jgi:hypothetical protein
MDSLKMVRSAENGWDVDGDKALMSAPPTDFYFEHTGFQQLSFPALVRETWGDFLGRITSLSLAPEANHPLRAKFEKALREVFEQHASDGVMNVHNATEVTLGR